MSNKDKDDLCDHNHEIIQDLILNRNKNDEMLNQNTHQNRTTTHNDERNQHFKRQLTSTSQYGDGDSQEDDNNPFIFITKGNKRKQRIHERSTPDSIENNENDVIEQSKSTKASSNNSRLFVNSRNKTNNSYRLYNNSC